MTVRCIVYLRSPFIINVIIDLYICVEHGMRIPAVALQLQEAVKEDIFQYTGITVAEVNVNVQQIVFSAAR